MDEKREWLKSKYGLPPHFREIPREINVCATTICGTDVFVVSDLSKDERFEHVAARDHVLDVADPPRADVRDVQQAVRARFPKTPLGELVLLPAVLAANIQR